MNDSETLQNIERKLSALISVLIHRGSTENGEKERKIEAVLSESGLTGPEIAAITGKNLPAVQKALQRAKGKK